MGLTFNWGLTTMKSQQHQPFLFFQEHTSHQKSSPSTRNIILENHKCFFPKWASSFFLLYKTRFWSQIAEKWFIRRILIIHRTDKKTKKLQESRQPTVTLQQPSVQESLLVRTAWHPLLNSTAASQPPTTPTWYHWSPSWSIQLAKLWFHAGALSARDLRNCCPPSPSTMKESPDSKLVEFAPE